MKIYELCNILMKRLFSIWYTSLPGFDQNSSTYQAIIEMHHIEHLMLIYLCHSYNRRSHRRLFCF